MRNSYKNIEIYYMLNSKNLEDIEKACVSKKISMGAKYIFRPNDTYKDKKGDTQTQPSCCIDSNYQDSHSLERIKCEDDGDTGYCLYCANAGPGPNCYADIVPESINANLGEILPFKDLIDEHGIDKVNETIKNYCEHFDLEFQPRIIFERVINSTAGFDGWLGYNNEVN